MIIFIKIHKLYMPKKQQFPTFTENQNLVITKEFYYV